MEFKGKTALITGAASGIGEAISYQLAKRGTNVILTGLGPEALDKVKNKCITEYGVKAESMEINLADTSTLDNLFDFVNSLHVNIDIFLLNAGISQRAKVFETDFSVDKKIMDIDYFGSVYLIKKFKDMLMASKYTAIGVTVSISGLFGYPLRSAYCASKHALFGFFESLELENPNLHVTFMIPGRVNTQISKSAMLGNGEKYDKMDPGQAHGIDVNKCAEKAVKAIAKGKHRKLLGSTELLMVYIHKYFLGLYYKLARKVSAV